MKNKVVELKIRKIMFEKNINQSKLADLLGVTKSVVSSWFIGTRNPTTDSIERIAKALGVSAAYLLDDSDDGQKNFVDNSGTIGYIGNNSGQISQVVNDVELLKQKNKTLELEIELMKTRLEKLEKKK